MKKTLAILLALLLVLVNVAALAEESAQPKYKSSAAFSFEPLPKEYTVTGTTDKALYPQETLEFTVTADTTGNPDHGDAVITVGANGDNKVVVTGVDGNTLKINVPALSMPGLYHWTVKEKKGNTQGVTYDTTTEIGISVLVTFSATDAAQLEVVDTAELKNYGITAKGEDGEKVSELTNTYKVADLVVTKTVSGNLGDKNKYFPVEVVLTPESGKTVLSDITITGETYSTKVEKIASNWNAAKTVTIWVKDGSTITFQNVPENVTYTVKETEATKHLGAASEEPNNPDAYLVGGEVKTAATISATEPNKVELTNKKDVKIDTGVNMETVPYIMLLAVAMIGIAVLALRKREEY